MQHRLGERNREPTRPDLFRPYAVLRAAGAESLGLQPDHPPGRRRQDFRRRRFQPSHCLSALSGKALSGKPSHAPDELLSAPVYVSVATSRASGAGVMHRRLLCAIVAAAMTAATSVAAHPLTEGAVAGSIRAADALAARIRSYPRGPAAWTGLTPVPASYCPTMREGEAVIKELARLAGRAILY